MTTETFHRTFLFDRTLEERCTVRRSPPQPRPENERPWNVRRTFSDEKWTSQLSFGFSKPLPAAPAERAAGRTRRDRRGARSPHRRRASVRTRVATAETAAAGNDRAPRLCVSRCGGGTGRASLEHTAVARCSRRGTAVVGHARAWCGRCHILCARRLSGRGARRAARQPQRAASLGHRATSERCAEAASWTARARGGAGGVHVVRRGERSVLGLARTPCALWSILRTHPVEAAVRDCRGRMQ